MGIATRAPVGELVEICGAEYHTSCPPYVLDDRRVANGSPMAEMARSERARDPADVNVVLDNHGHPIERQWLTFLPRTYHTDAVDAGNFRCHGDDGSEPTIVSGDELSASLHECGDVGACRTGRKTGGRIRHELAACSWRRRRGFGRALVPTLISVDCRISKTGFSFSEAITLPAISSMSN